jgi:hypothetical protein
VWITEMDWFCLQQKSGFWRSGRIKARFNTQKNRLSIPNVFDQGVDNLPQTKSGKHTAFCIKRRDLAHQNTSSSKLNHEPNT